VSGLSVPPLVFDKGISIFIEPAGKSVPPI